MIDEPTLRLRFVKRNERFILQQCWRVIHDLKDERTVSYEWRDVPVEDKDESVR